MVSELQGAVVVYWSWCVTVTELILVSEQQLVVVYRSWSVTVPELIVVSEQQEAVVVYWSVAVTELILVSVQQMGVVCWIVNVIERIVALVVVLACWTVTVAVFSLIVLRELMVVVLTSSFSL